MKSRVYLTSSTRKPNAVSVKCTFTHPNWPISQLVKAKQLNIKHGGGMGSATRSNSPLDLDKDQTIDILCGKKRLVTPFQGAWGVAFQCSYFLVRCPLKKCFEPLRRKTLT